MALKVQILQDRRNKKLILESEELRMYIEKYHGNDIGGTDVNAQDLEELIIEWNDNEEYNKIVDALERIPVNERTPEQDSELAKAYNNIAVPDSRELLKKAIALLEPHEEYFEGDHCWNYRMAFSYYYLDQEGVALRYFEKALEARPGDEDTEEYIEDCKKRISLPGFEMNFRERTTEAWKCFADKEAELRHIMDEDKEKRRGEELIEKCGEILEIAFYDVSFEMGYNGEKYELILTPEGDKVKLFELVYFVRHVPKSLLDNWNILVGRQADENIGLRVDETDISGEDVQVWLEQVDEHNVALSVYCEKLVPLLKENEGKAWWILTTLTDQILGEICHMRYIYSFDVLTSAKEDEAIKLSELPEKMKDMGFELINDPEAYLECYNAYEMKPVEDADADWRLDTIVGSTCCSPIVQGYLSGDDEDMDMLHADGAVAGFLCYPLDVFTGEDRSRQIFDFRDKLEEKLAGESGSDILTLIGGATGVNYGYVDFIAWDLQAALYMAKEFFEETDIPWANFHTFRRVADTINLKRTDGNESDNEEERLTESECAQESSKGVFVGFVLLSEGEWNKEQFICDMKEKWDITINEDDKNEEKSDDTLVFEYENMIGAVSLMPSPVPDGEAELNAENNFMWPDAVNIAKEHKAHIMVAVLGKEEDVFKRGKFYTKLVSACCRQKYATGVYTSGVVFEPRFYEGFADMMKDGGLPIFNWIWFGLYRNEGGTNAYTYGMDVFGKDEIEVLNADANPSEVRDFLAGIVSYVLESDVELHDGETIGFSKDDIHKITRSEGISVPGMTLKISYAPSEPDNKTEPVELAKAMMDYLDCECVYFPSMQDDSPIMSAYNDAVRDGLQEGFVPVLIAFDETLWECLIMNSDTDSDGEEDYFFDKEAVANYRKQMLSDEVKDGKKVLGKLIGQRQEEAEDDDIDWEEEIIGTMDDGFENNRFASYWNLENDMTYPLILAKIPVKNPWEVFAYLPFGNWNECPDTPELMAAAKYWFEQYGAVPAAITHDVLEFRLPAPVPEEKALEAAAEQYGFCPDIVEQGPEEATVGSLAGVLCKSDVWYFWWD